MQCKLFEEDEKFIEQNCSFNQNEGTLEFSVA